MQPGVGGTRGEGPCGIAKRVITTPPEIFLEQKSRCCISTASHQLYRSTAYRGNFSHLHNTTAATGLVSQGTGTYTRSPILNTVAETDDFWSSVFLLMSNVGWLAVKNIWFCGCWIKFQLGIRAFCNYEFDLKYKMCIKVIRKKWGNCRLCIIYGYGEE